MWGEKIFMNLTDAQIHSTTTGMEKKGEKEKERDKSVNKRMKEGES